MPIPEDLTKINNKITSIKRDNNRLVVKKYSGNEELIYFNDLIPDFSETNSSKKEFIKNKPTVYNITSFIEIGEPKKMDIAILQDGSRFIYNGYNWFKIVRDIVDDSTQIRIPKYVKGKLYRKESIVEKNGHIFVSLRDTFDDPVAWGAQWRLISEYDMFVNRCELTTPKLSGYFIVAGSYYAEKQVTVENEQDFANFFGSNNGISSDIDGFYLDTKVNSEFCVNIDTNIKYLDKLNISIKPDITESAKCRIEIYLDNGDLLLALEDLAIEHEELLYELRLVKENGQEIYDVVYTEDTIIKEIDLSRIEKNYTKFCIKYIVDDNDDVELAKHRIKFDLIYKEIVT